MRNKSDAAPGPSPLIQIKLVSLNLLRPHPRNPRTLRTNTPEFRDLVESIRIAGIREPLVVRDDPLERDGMIKQILSGHRRFAAAGAAGLDAAPVYDQGMIADKLAYDILAAGNLHEPLTAIEEGKRVAYWLDEYGEDVKAVAGKLGKTERWVVEHAQIVRGLSPEWIQEAEKNEYMDRWTSSHWAVIAKLPLRIQTSELSKFHGGYCSYDRWSVAELERRVKIETFELAKAPFDTEAVCEGCLSRTDVQPLLWADKAEEATGKHARCLDRKCYQNNADRVERQKVRDVAEAKGLGKPLAISTLEPPDSKDYDYRRNEEYKHKIVAARRVHKGVLEMGDYKIVEEGAKGAVAAVVVAGRGNGAVKWIKPVERKEKDSPTRARTPSARDLKQQKETDRWNRLHDCITQKIAGAPMPSSEVLLFLLSLVDPPDLWKDREAKIKKLQKTWKEGDLAEFGQMIRQWYWDDLSRHEGSGLYFIDGAEEALRAICPFFGIDVDAEYKLLLVADEMEASAADSAEPGTPAKDPAPPAKQKSGRSKKVETSKTDCSSDCENCSQPNCNGRQEEFARKARDLSPATKGASCDGNPETCDIGCQPCLAKSDPQSVHEVAPSGLILTPEIVQIEVPQAWKAKVEISLGCVKGQWYFGCSAHVPGAGLPHPCSIHHTAYGNRSEALQAATVKISAWLDGKPGRRRYKYYAEIAAKLGELAGRTITQESLTASPGDGSPATSPDDDIGPMHMLQVALPQSYDAEIVLFYQMMAQMWHGGFKARIGKSSIDLPPHQADDCFEMRRECLGDVMNLIQEWMVEADNKVPQKTRVLIVPRIEEAIEAEIDRLETDKTARALRVDFGDIEAHCTILCQRFSGKWHGGFAIAVKNQTGQKPVTKESPGLESKAACLQAMVVSISQWLDSSRTKICNQGLRIEVFAKIEEAVGQELAKQTCRVCGCTPDNCQQCIERTGKPCTWIQPDLCSACAEPGGQT